MSMDNYVDRAAGLYRVRGNESLYNRMLQMFLDSKEFAELDEALESGNWPRAGEVAHGIKGMTGNLALTALYQASEKLMNEMRDGDAPQDASVAEYREALEKTLEYIKAMF